MVLRPPEDVARLEVAVRDAGGVELLEAGEDVAEHGEDGGEVGLDAHRPLVEGLALLDDDARREDVAGGVADRAVGVGHDVLHGGHHAPQVLPRVQSLLPFKRDAVQEELDGKLVIVVAAARELHDALAADAPVNLHRGRRLTLVGEPGVRPVCNRTDGRGHAAVPRPALFPFTPLPRGERRAPERVPIWVVAAVRGVVGSLYAGNRARPGRAGTSRGTGEAEHPACPQPSRGAYPGLRGHGTEMALEQYGDEQVSGGGGLYLAVQLEAAEEEDAVVVDLIEGLLKALSVHDLPTCAAVAGAAGHDAAEGRVGAGGDDCGRVAGATGADHAVPLLRRGDAAGRGVGEEGGVVVDEAVWARVAGGGGVGVVERRRRV